MMILKLGVLDDQYLQEHRAGLARVIPPEDEGIYV
jgi:hypothetical protein